MHLLQQLCKLNNKRYGMGIVGTFWAGLDTFKNLFGADSHSVLSPATRTHCKQITNELIHTIQRQDKDASIVNKSSPYLEFYLSISGQIQLKTPDMPIIPSHFGGTKHIP